MKLPITSIIPGSTADEYIDQILDNVQKYIKDNSLDPMDLPDYTYNFTKEVRNLLMLFGFKRIHCSMNHR